MLYSFLLLVLSLFFFIMLCLGAGDIFLPLLPLFSLFPDSQLSSTVSLVSWFRRGALRLWSRPGGMKKEEES